MDNEEKDNITIDELKDLMALAQAADMQGRNEDVEERLQQFYGKQQARKRKARLWRIGMAAAAAIALLLTMAIWNGVAENETPQEQQPIVFYIAKPKANIEVKTERGTRLRSLTNNSDEELVAEALPTEAEAERIVVDVPQGEKLTVALPDGSKVYMHAGSSLKFPSRFADSLRLVELRGEAYFVVARNPEQPFVVRTQTMQTTVLGTEFNILAEGTPADCVSLVSGSVKVSAGGKRRIIKPGQQLSVSPEGKLTVREVDMTPYTSWRDGYIYFDNVSLKEALLNIAKEFNCNVEFCHQDLLDTKVHFVADRSEGIKGVIDGLNMMKIVNVDFEGHMIVVY
ncbi:MAG: FecR family protein [Prevotella sp.]